MRTLLFVLLTTTAAFAQALSFEVASVRPNILNDQIVTIDPGPGGRFQARGYTLQLLIQHAYDVKGFQISGGPTWLDEDRYDIVARGRADATPQELRLMLQALLADRFALKIHKIQKEMPGFELSLIAGPKNLERSVATETTTSRDGTGARIMKGMSMPAFAVAMGSYVGRPVVDKTGLQGLYDLKIHWTLRADQVPDADGNGVTLISALRDQLGMRLTSKRVEAEVIVIDSAAKATAN